MVLRPPGSPLFPYTTLFRSIDVGARSTAPYLDTEISEAEERDRLAWAVELLARKVPVPISADTDRKSTRLNSSHTVISYAVFCLKKKTRQTNRYTPQPYYQR